MESTSSRLALTDHLVLLLRRTPTSIIDCVVYLIQGKLRPDYEGVELGIADKLAIRAISLTTGTNISIIEQLYRKTGDLGDTVAEALNSKSQRTFLSEKLTVERVYQTLDKAAHCVGPGSQEAKLKLVSSLLTDGSSRESRYVMKFIMGTLRLGIADYTVIDALALSFTGIKANRAIIENAYNISSDLGTIARVLATKGLDSLKSLRITLHKPIRPMLAERVRNVQEVIERLNGQPGAVEYKLDGERVQVHKGANKIMLFSRRLENITSHYPDIVEAITQLKTGELIIEGEIVAINSLTGEFLPFQELMHRRRKHGIEEAIGEYPVVVNVFDILYFEGKDVTSLPYLKRRDLIEKIVTSKDIGKVNLVPQRVVSNIEDLEKLMNQAIEIGCEGLMIKQPSSIYRAGAREFAWTKLKREYRSDLADTVDLVIVGALYGRGRRVGKYGAILLAVYDTHSDIFRSTCKVGTGFSDEHLEFFYKSLDKIQLTHRHPRVDAGINMDVWFEPKIVIEVSASEITLSPSHPAGLGSIRENYGLALRFPKFTGRTREDKNPEDATTVDELINMYKRQLRSVKKT